MLDTNKLNSYKKKVKKKQSRKVNYPQSVIVAYDRHCIYTSGTH